MTSKFPEGVFDECREGRVGIYPSAEELVTQPAEPPLCSFSCLAGTLLLVDVFF